MTDDHAPSHEEIYEMAVQDKEEDMADLSPVVAVKPIHWDKHPDYDEWYALLSDSNYGPEMGYIITKTVKGNYRLHMRSGDEKVGKYTTFDSAANAATEHQRAYILSQLEAQPTWRGMESAPKDGTVIFVWHEGSTNQYASFDASIKKAKWVSDIGEWSVENVGGNVPPELLCWKPLPTPPSEGA